MPKLNNPLEIYKFLPQKNCRECGLKTCLAFADAVFKGNKQLPECPHLDESFINQYNGKIIRPLSIEQQQELVLENLKKDVRSINFAASANRLGAAYANGSLKIKSLGKDFIVDPNGNITSDCHINTWVTVPLLNYIISSKGEEFSGKWVPFRELKNGRIRQPLFEQRCEKVLQQIADKHTDLFEQILYVFGGKPVENNFSSDLALILHPLPKVPMLFVYSRTENGFDSNFNIFFADNAENNLGIESIHMLCSGMTIMFEKITSRHGLLNVI